ncbi:MAG: CrcB family protein [Ktedonobacteraceae bacterium]|nr:CrcB family protein [Ktedonobacteraceae bacterium]
MQASLSLPRRVGAILAGGFLGATARYLLSILIQSYLGKGWPYDILLINITGALALAFITTLADATFLIGPTRRLFINVGFLGAYTTFSSLALGDVRLFASGDILPALVYLCASILGGLIAVLISDWLGQLLINRVRGSSGMVAGTTPAPARGTKEEDHLDIQDDVTTP